VLYYIILATTITWQFKFLSQLYSHGFPEHTDSISIDIILVSILDELMLSGHWQTSKQKILVNMYNYTNICIYVHTYVCLYATEFTNSDNRVVRIEIHFIASRNIQNSVVTIWHFSMSYVMNVYVMIWTYVMTWNSTSPKTKKHKILKNNGNFRCPIP